MAWVTPTVEIAFASTPLATTPVWTDVTAHVVGPLSIKQGREVELEAPAVGQLSLTLDNRDRRYDPSHTTGPHYGNLSQRKRIRVRANGTDLFTGWITGWPQTLDTLAGNSVVQLEAVDALGMLALTPLGQTPHVSTVLQFDPDGYWRLDDDDITRAIDSSGNDHHAGLNIGSVGKFKKVQASDVAYPLGNKGAVTWNKDAAGYYYSIPALYAGVTPKRYQAISAWMFSANNGTEIPEYSSGPAYGVDDFIEVLDSRPVVGNSDGALLALSGVNIFSDVDGTYLTWSQTGQAVRDGLWHHLFIVVDRTANLARLYIDGIAQGDLATSAGKGFWNTTYAPTGYRIRRPTTRLWYSQPRADSGASNVAFFQSDSADLWTAGPTLHEAGLGWPGHTEADRVAAVLDLGNWPTALRTAGYQGSGQPTETELPANLLAYLLSMTRQDGSTLLAMRDGTVKFRNRSALHADARSTGAQAAFGDDSSFSYRYADIAPAVDDEYVYNAISATRKGGEKQYLMKDQASIETYYHRILDLGDIRAIDDLDVATFVAWLLRTYSQPRARLRSLIINARYDTATLGKVIDLWLGDRITASFTPLGVGTATVYDQWIESVQHDIDMSALTWLTTYTTSPATGTSTDAFRLDSSLLDSAATLGQ